MPFYFTGHVCSLDRFRCQNHVCIPIRYRCDDWDDCGDGSDEKNCSGKDVFNFSFFVMFILCLNDTEFMG